MVEKSKKDPKKSAEKPISLKPLKFEEAVRDLLRVRPKKDEGGDEEKRGE